MNMRILVVCSKNSGKIAPFIQEQAEAIQQMGTEVDFFTIEGKGWKGYLKNRPFLTKKIKEFKPNVIHAHYGLSGLLANTQRKVPVVTTYHGSDINDPKVFRFSKWAMRLSVWNIFVSEKNIRIAKVKKKYTLIPCGINTELFKPVDKHIARKKFGFSTDEKLILFAGSFDNPVKNSALALQAINFLSEVRLLELKNYSREEVALLMNAVDVCLMTSLSEGSPQFIKEAMACNCPIVSVNVGDVKEQIEGVENCFITEARPEKIAEKIDTIFTNRSKRTNGREKLMKSGLEQSVVAKQLIKIYRKYA
jgi:teichuronic acid biosynthesis glycosyltransferase TuaC